MLLKLGVIMMAVAVALAAGVAVMVSLRAESPAPAATPTSSVATETPAQENGPDPGQTLDLGGDTAGKATQDLGGDASPSAKRDVKTLPISAGNWPKPSEKEISTTQSPRYYQPQQDAELSLTVGALGLYNVPVLDSKGREALDQGVVHLPETPMPWDSGEQKNVYLAGHRVGYPGTDSRLIFYNLDKLKNGDPITLKDGSGTSYQYRVSEMFVVDPNANWAEEPVRGRDMVTLQTCTYPNFNNRLIVRADRI
jgi:sortase A